VNRTIACLSVAVGCWGVLAGEPPPSDQPRDQRFAASGEVDLYVAASAGRNLKAEDERLWVPALKLGQEVIRRAEKEEIAPNLPIGPELTFATWCRRTAPQFVRTAQAYTCTKADDDKHVGGRTLALRADSVSAERSFRGLVVTRGPVNVKTAIRDSLVLATGDVMAQDVLNSLVICDGDVVTLQALQSIIITRGKILVKRNSTACALIAGGTAEAGEVPERKLPPLHADDPKSVLVWKAAMSDLRDVQVIARAKETNPLKFITFFELSRVGLSVKAADGAVTVAAVAPGSVGEKAGVKAGDVVLEAGGKQPADVEALRRLLRDALAVGDAAVKLKRGDETLSVKLALPE
jgi:hypothetical protein